MVGVGGSAASCRQAGRSVSSFVVNSEPISNAPSVTSAWRILLPPVVVFAVHLCAWRAGAYDVFPRLDVVMHLLGGFLVAGVLAWSLDWSAARGWIAPVDSRVAMATVLGLVTVVAVVWEFFEFGLDSLIATRYQHGLGDTLRDLALSMAGGAAFLLTRAWRRRTAR
jgi:hypothetical protein